MTWIQLLGSGPWMAWLIKLVVILEVALLSRNWAKQIVGFYHSGPMGEVSLAIAFGVLGFYCLNGIFSGFERGNMLGFAAGLMGIFLIGKGFLLLFAPHYLIFIPF
jgi:hypothetical protein